MQIVEIYTQSKYGQPERNEDVIVTSQHFAAVIDGATDLSGITVDGMTAGRYAAQTVAAAIETLPHDLSAPKAFDYITAYFQTDKASRNLPGGFHPFCVAAIYSKYRREIFYLKDIRIKLNGIEKNSEIKAIEPLIALRQVYLHALLAQKGARAQDYVSADPFHPILKQVCDVNHTLLNNKGSPFGFGVINAQPIPHEFIETIPVPAGSDLIIASDGYPVLENTLAETEEALDKILAADPLLIDDFPQPRGIVKTGLSFDDRSWLRLKT